MGLEKKLNMKFKPPFSEFEYQRFQEQYPELCEKGGREVAEFYTVYILQFQDMYADLIEAMPKFGKLKTAWDDLDFDQMREVASNITVEGDTVEDDKEFLWAYFGEVIGAEMAVDSLISKLRDVRHQLALMEIEALNYVDRELFEVADRIGLHDSSVWSDEDEDDE